jgi:hypothetical protein
MCYRGIDRFFGTQSKRAKTKFYFSLKQVSSHGARHVCTCVHVLACVQCPFARNTKIDICIPCLQGALKLVVVF